MGEGSTLLRVCHCFRGLFERGQRCHEYVPINQTSPATVLIVSRQALHVHAPTSNSRGKRSKWRQGFGVRVTVRSTRGNRAQSRESKIARPRALYSRVATSDSLFRFSQYFRWRRRIVEGAGCAKRREETRKNSKDITIPISQ